MGSVIVSFSIFILMVLALGATVAVAQPGGKIVAAPGAQRLQPIWIIEGDPIAGYDGVGYGVGDLGDVFGIGRSAWAVHTVRGAVWQVFASDSVGPDSVVLDVEPRWTFSGATGDIRHPIVGDFWGSGHKAIGFMQRQQDYCLFRTDSNRLPDTPTVVIAPQRLSPSVTLHPMDVLAADLDNDGADEMIVFCTGLVRGGEIDYNPQIWIYKGGPNFGADSPTVIIETPRLNSLGSGRLSISIGNFNNDHYPDIVVAGAYRDLERWLTFYWGTESLKAFNDPMNVRDIALDGNKPVAEYAITGLDADGDSLTDLVIGDGSSGSYLFRSSGGKNARTRSFARDDADMMWPARPASGRGGYMNDSARRYEMLLLYGTTPMLFGGGPQGPDSTYEAWAPTGVFGISSPLGDVDGDGWCDIIAGNYTFGALQHGIAAIYPGGPYIPKTSSVQRVATQEHEAAVSVWPNPVRDVLHVAWRGDLRRMPRRFVIHDVQGREVVSGEVAAGSSSVEWRCGEVAAGVYLVTILDAAGQMLATVQIMKQ